MLIGQVIDFPAIFRLEVELSPARRMAFILLERQDKGGVQSAQRSLAKAVAVQARESVGPYRLGLVTEDRQEAMPMRRLWKLGQARTGFFDKIQEGCSDIDRLRERADATAGVIVSRQPQNKRNMNAFLVQPRQLI